MEWSRSRATRRSCSSDPSPREAITTFEPWLMFSSMRPTWPHSVPGSFSDAALRPDVDVAGEDRSPSQERNS